MTRPSFSPPPPACPCASSASFFADATYRCPRPLRAAVEKAAMMHPEHFSSGMLWLTEENFSAMSDGYYRCTRCLCRWHIEFASEEEAWPLFGVKSTEEAQHGDGQGPWDDRGVAAARVMALELLLGVSEAPCAYKGCRGAALRNVAICADHYSFPW